MGRSLRFRVYATRLDALLGLAFASASPLGLTLPRNVTRRPIMQKVRGDALPCGHSAPTACRHTVSGTISLPSPGFFSPFPRGTCSLSVASQYLALPDGPGRFTRNFSCSVLLGIQLRFKQFRLPDCHRLWCAFPDIFNYRYPISYAVPLPRLYLRTTGLGSSPFTRRY